MNVAEKVPPLGSVYSQFACSGNVPVVPKNGFEVDVQLMKKSAAGTASRTLPVGGFLV